MLRATTACTFSTSNGHLDVQKWSVPQVFCHFLLPNVLRATTACTFSTSQRPKVVRDPRMVLPLFTSKCASRHNGVHFFHISTSKSSSEHGVFCHFLTSKCASRHNSVHFFNISTSNVLRPWCAFYILTWKCASRHNGMHFFDIATSKSAPSMVCFGTFHFQMCFAPRRRALVHLSSAPMPPHLQAASADFSEPTFRPSGATKHRKKHSVPLLSYLFVLSDLVHL